MADGPDDRDDDDRDDDHRDARSETEDERADRRYAELLQELRVAQTGVQFLFAFLLTLAFTQRFVRITDFQLGLYVGTLVASAVAAALLIGPVPFHRIVFRRGLKPRLVAGADAAGIWTVEAVVFPENAASVAMLEGCGFRVVGRRERLGELHGEWRDVLLLERRGPEP